MNRFSHKRWLQDRPLNVQLWLVLSLLGTLAIAGGFAYALLVIFPGVVLDREQWRQVLYLFLMVVIANLFLSRLVSIRITEPFERLAESMGRIKHKNWEDKIQQVGRKDEVGRIINTLSQIQRNVIEINEDEEFFYQSVSHGLKTPIMVIQNCCAAYHDGIYGDEAIDIIMGESQALEKGIKKLLYVSSFDHMLGKQSDFQPVSLGDMAEDCRRRFVGNERGIAVTADLPTAWVVLGNPAPLQTVFDNVVENALRYALTAISIYGDEEEDGYVVSFENDGQPLSQAVMDVLFQKFYKGADGNFGLGLYIAKKIALFHKGDIWAENCPDGVRFRLLLKKP